MTTKRKENDGDGDGDGRSLTVSVRFADAAFLDRVVAAVHELGLKLAHTDEHADVLVSDQLHDGTVPMVLIGELEVILAGLRHGARGGLRPSFSPRQLKIVISAAVAGLVCSDIGPNESEFDRYVSRRPHALSDEQPAAQPLTPRETEVLALMTTGASNKQIARVLEISVHTAKFHVASIIAKLGASGRTDAVARSIHAGQGMI